MSTDLSIRITLVNCENQTGAIERDFAVQAFDSKNDRCFSDQRPLPVAQFEPIFPCAEADEFIIQVGQSKVFNNQIPLTVGGVYYIQVGTSGATHCRYDIEVLAGSTAVPTLPEPRLSNVGSVCLGETIRYAAQDTVPITQYVITLNGDTISRDYATEITWDTAGVYELCLQQQNPCDVQEPRCYTIPVAAPPPVDTLVYVCPDDCVTVFDSVLCVPDQYVYDYTDDFGCRATATVTVLPYANDTTLLFAQICRGDTLTYQGQDFATEGRYEWSLNNQQGCDSTVYLDVALVDCPVELTATHQDIRCHGSADGVVTVDIQSGFSPYSYVFRQLGGDVIASGTITGTTTTSFENLPPGTYLLDVTDRGGNEGHVNVTLLQPDPLSGIAAPVDYAGVQISCHGEQDGEVRLNASGGVRPYLYRLLDGVGNPPNSSGQFTDLTAGVYPYMVTDANGCEFAATFTLRQPEPLRQNVGVDDETCVAAVTGVIIPLSTGGGTAPYVQILTGEDGTVYAPPYDSLAAGQYFFFTRDANDCRVVDTVRVNAPLRAQVQLTIDRPLRPQGEAATVRALTLPENELWWFSPSGDTLCQSCATLTLEVLENTWVFAQAISVDGCIAADSLLINVYPVRDAYLPSAFSPNGDGINDRLIVYGGPTVARYTLRVHDRWGAEIYVSSAEDTRGWDGQINGRPAASGVYVYSVLIEYWDGATQIRNSEVILLR